MAAVVTGLFACDKCDANFAVKSGLTVHIGNKHGDGRPFSLGFCSKLLICDLCGSDLKRKQRLWDHIKNTHGKSDSFGCDLCSKLFNSKCPLPRHIRTRHQQNISHAYKCRLCPAEYIDKVNLQHHRTIIHDGVRFECDDCGKLFGQKGNLMRHIASVHLGLRPFECVTCGAKSSCALDLQRHIDVQHKGEQVQCDHCGKTAGDKFNLTKHIVSVHVKFRKFKCDQCPAASYEQSALKRHKQNVHSKMEFMCDFCSRMFTNKDPLANHYFAIHLMLRALKCSLCDEKFSHPSTLSIHKKKIHR